MNWRTDFENMPRNGDECFVWAMSCDGRYRPMVVFWAQSLYDDLPTVWILCENHDLEIRDFTHWAQIEPPIDINLICGNYYQQSSIHYEKVANQIKSLFDVNVYISIYIIEGLLHVSIGNIGKYYAQFLFQDEDKGIKDMAKILNMRTGRKITGGGYYMGDGESDFEQIYAFDSFPTT